MFSMAAPNDSFAPMSSLIPRRSFLVGSAAGLLATACGDDAPSAKPTTTARAEYQLIENFPRSEPYAAAGAPQRLPFLIAGPDGAPLDDIRGEVTFALSREGDAIGSPITVTPHHIGSHQGAGHENHGGVQRAYLPVEVTFPEVGIYDLAATYEGNKLTSTVQAVDPSTVKLPQVGSPLPSAQTPTTEDHRGVEPLCTRDPICPFHSVSLADALSAGRPTLLLVSTPRYCQIAICGPVLEELIEAASGRSDIAVIHHEVYANPEAVDSISEATLAPLLGTYGMTFEPSLFATNRDGTLVSRLDMVYDAEELSKAIEAALA